MSKEKTDIEKARELLKLDMDTLFSGDAIKGSVQFIANKYESHIKAQDDKIKKLSEINIEQSDIMITMRDQIQSFEKKEREVDDEIKNHIANYKCILDNTSNRYRKKEMKNKIDSLKTLKIGLKQLTKD